MLQINLEKISYQYESSQNPVFENISAAVYEGDKIALIGANGCGKTTLLKIIDGVFSPGSGTVTKKENLKTAFLMQENITQGFEKAIEFLLSSEKELLDIYRKLQSADEAAKCELYSLYSELGGFEIESEIEKKRDLFGFDADFYEKNPENFSGGEKVKLALLKIIITNPDIILLDEPTNHLDTEAIIWLENFVKNIDITTLIVSHDRKFIDSCVTSLWELSHDSIRKISGNYSDYKSFSEKERAEKLKIYEEAKESIRKLKKTVAEKKVHAEKNEKFKPSRSVKKNGGLCKIDDGERKLVREQNIMKGAKILEKRIEEISRGIENLGINKKEGIKLILNSGNVKNRFVVKIDNISKTFGNKEVFANFSLTAENSEKIALTGKNGSGKSTLLKIIAGFIEADSGEITIAPSAKVSYFAQEFDNLKKDDSIIEAISPINTEKEKEARTILACLNIKGDKVYQKIRTLSAGEKSKVAITRMLVGNYDLLLLDEPMSHLEISSREALENALLNYNGTVICVTHDRAFAEKFAARIVVMG